MGRQKSQSFSIFSSISAIYEIYTEKSSSFSSSSMIRGVFSLNLAASDMQAK